MRIIGDGGDNEGDGDDNEDSGNGNDVYSDDNEDSGNGNDVDSDDDDLPVQLLSRTGLPGHTRCTETFLLSISNQPRNEKQGIRALCYIEPMIV